MNMDFTISIVLSGVALGVGLICVYIVKSFYDNYYDDYINRFFDGKNTTKIYDIEKRVINLHVRIEDIEKSLRSQKEAKPEAPHGLKKDGTPKAKPGRKTK